MRIRDYIFYTSSLIAICLFTLGIAFPETNCSYGGWGLLIVNLFMLYGLISERNWWSR